MSETTEHNGALPVRSLDDILADLERQGPPTRDVPIPEWGAVFTVRGLTRAEVFHVGKQTNDMLTGRLLKPELNEEMQLILGIVRPKFTSAHYKRLQHRVEATPILTRLMQAIGELTNGPAITAPNGKEADAVDAAYFPADRPLAATTGAE